MHKPIGLVAKDREDLSIVSSLLQDSLFFAFDVQHNKENNYFSIFLNRFVWESSDQLPPYMRVHTTLCCRQVVRVYTENIFFQDRSIHSLLSLSSSERKSENLDIHLVLAGNSILRLTVTDINIIIKDLGLCWQTNVHPRLG